MIETFAFYMYIFVCILYCLDIFLFFVQGAFITACADDSVHLWSYRQKIPEIVHSLKFSRERLAAHNCICSFSINLTKEWKVMPNPGNNLVKSKTRH